jgi:hypothetical protein
MRNITLKWKIVRMGVDINLKRLMKVEKELISVERRVITQLQNADSSKREYFHTV